MFNKMVIWAAIISTAVTVFFIGGQVAAASFVGLGIVFAAAIVIHKFKTLRKFVFKFDKYIDLALFIGSLLAAHTIFMYIVAVFSGIYITAYLSIVKNIYSKNNLKGEQA